MIRVRVLVVESPKHTFFIDGILFINECLSSTHCQYYINKCTHYIDVHTLYMFVYTYLCLQNYTKTNKIWDYAYSKPVLHHIFMYIK